MQGYNISYWKVNKWDIKFSDYPYGEGEVAKKITKLIENFSINNETLNKKI